MSNEDNALERNHLLEGLSWQDYIAHPRLVELIQVIKQLPSDKAELLLVKYVVAARLAP